MTDLATPEPVAQLCVCRRRTTSTWPGLTPTSRRAERAGDPRHQEPGATAASIRSSTRAAASTTCSDVKLGITYVSEFAYLADGKNGLRVVQLTSPETPGNDGFSPRPTPQLIATCPTTAAGAGDVRRGWTATGRWTRAATRSPSSAASAPAAEPGGAAADVSAPRRHPLAHDRRPAPMGPIVGNFAGSAAHRGARSLLRPPKRLEAPAKISPYRTRRLLPSSIRQ